MALWTLLLASYGLCFGLMNDKTKMLTDLLKRLPVFRDEDGENWFERMLRCPYCVGFHTGWMVWVLGVLPSLVLAGTLEPSHGGEVVAFAFASSAFCYAVDTIIQWFER